ncbi:uncharacterized protein N7484_006001 [Penicillium longicatenatum]|uniref:uncharacterized protein n=1 Tax=Penicillium longicatenatum TaxID=1561947 RepID=UPI00254909C1|nr:uncharacterized protein N7484_006001 [Penicillium longicatenatum]KAJ5643494.1 hypothetical protein N7484_006001 [Penicillium longicatenatum]
MSGNSDKFQVIIAGAGIAGLATAISLKRISSIPDLDIQLYEQAHQLLEIGASIALSPNGMRTLEKLGVDNALSDEVGFRGPSGIPQILRHWKTNQVVSVDTHTDVPDSRHHTTRFHRGHLHAALLEHVPKECVHLGKKITRANVSDDGVSLHFEDGTCAYGHILIGADGIRSKVRQSFIPNYRLLFSGKISMRSTFDASLVAKIPNLPEDSSHWWGPQDNFFASRLGKGQYTIVGAYSDPRPSEELDRSISWDQKGDVRFLREKYKDWNPLVQALTEATPHTNLYPNFVGASLENWVFGSRVTLVGDAAHAHGGAFAAGGSLALDDAFALGLAFKHVVKSSDGKLPLLLDDIEKALEFYTNTRKPHTDRLLHVVHHQIGTKTPVSGTLEEDAKLVSRMKNRPDTVWLSEHDVEAAMGATIAQAEVHELKALGGEQDIQGKHESTVHSTRGKL